MASKTTSTIAARVPNEVKAMLDNALKRANCTTKDIAIDFAEKLHTGEIEIANGKIILYQPIEENELDMSNFMEACDSKGVKPQDAVNKMAQMIWRG